MKLLTGFVARAYTMHLGDMPYTTVYWQK